MTNDEQTEPDFASWLATHRKGALDAELAIARTELVKAVDDTGKAGALTLTIKIAPGDKGGGEMMIVTDEVKVKLPEHDRPVAFYFCDANGQLVRDDPNRPSLFDTATEAETADEDD